MAKPKKFYKAYYETELHQANEPEIYTSHNLKDERGATDLEKIQSVYQKFNRTVDDAMLERHLYKVEKVERIYFEEFQSLGITENSK